MAFEKTLQDFLSHYEGMTEETYHKEFVSLKLQSQKYKEKGTYPADAGQLPCNKKKNRFKDILPFEYTRVSLHPVEGVEGSDYINANYITGTGDAVTYIAAQGPLPNTVCDFWRMLWYHSIEIVVMACKIVENAKAKCEHYWPEKNSTKEFAGITVTTIAEENKSNDFVVRDFLVECGGEKQYIRQYHYTAWPDHGKPDSAEPIIKMLEMVHTYRKSMDIPLLFHCSAGCGRTGTMIAIDTARTMFLNKSLPEKFSVHSLVENMRRQRPSMVQAKDQYQFVYDATGELARRALGFNPTLPAKPPPSSKVAVENSLNGVYQNTAPSPLTSSPSPDPPLSQKPGETTTAGYGNTPTPGQPLSEGSSSPAPSPPTGKKPVARQRSSKSSIEPSYENVPSISAPPVPLPKIPRASSPVPGSSPVPSPKPRRTVRRHKEQPPTPGSDDSPGIKPSMSKKLPPPPARKPTKEKSPSEGAPTPPPPAHKPTKEKSPSEVAPTPPPPAHKPTKEKSPSEGAPTPPPARKPAKEKPPLNRAPTPPLAHKPKKEKSMEEAPTPPPARKPTKEKSPMVPTPPPARTSTPLKSKEPEKLPSSQEESVYSNVDMSQITDTGPGIKVLDERSGKKAPLDKIENHLETTGQMDISKSSSIMDTLLSLVGDDVINEVEANEEEDERPPTPPPVGRRTMSMLSDAPPAIPMRTEASYHLVEEMPDEIEPVDYNNVSPPEDNFMGGTADYELVSAGPPEIKNVRGPGYEAPTPLSKPVSSPPPLPAERQSKSPSMEFLQPSSALTLPAGSGSSTSNHSPGPTRSTHSALGKIGKISKLFKKQSDKKRSSADISGPVIVQKTDPRMARSPSDHGISSSSSSSRPSPSHSTSSLSANQRYNFPGELGYGVRICKPIGPRQEPHGWKVRTLTNSVA